MKLYLIEKIKGRIYKSELIIRALFDSELRHNEDGTPEFDDGFISISDTKNFWISAVSDKPVGIDIEESSRIVKPAIVKRFHKTEREYLGGLEEMSREWKEETLSVWVKKEAYMKLKGQGLKMGLSSFSVIDNDSVYSFRYKKLYVGIAGESDYSIQELSYDAPFEKSCFDAAADLLDVRMYSEAELRKKLAEKSYSEDDINSACEKLKEYAYLNDERFASAYAEKLSREGKGVRKIEFELIKKGIDRQLAKNKASAYRSKASENAMEIALKALGKLDLKTCSREEREKYLTRVGRKLASLGYETSVIYDTIDKLRL